MNFGREKNPKKNARKREKIRKKGSLFFVARHTLSSTNSTLFNHLWSQNSYASTKLYLLCSTMFRHKLLATKYEIRYSTKVQA